MDDIERRILEAVVELATEGGFEAVRQRDVAARAEVALGTLYSRFESKDLLLTSALVLATERTARAVEAQPLRGRTPVARVATLFENLTAHFTRHPKLARAVLRGTASGEAPVTRLLTAQERLTSLVAAALKGSGPEPALPAEAARRVGLVLVMVWYANLVGWAGGVATPEVVVQVLRDTADMLLHGVTGKGTPAARRR